MKKSTKFVLELIGVMLLIVAAIAVIVTISSIRVPAKAEEDLATPEVHPDLTIEEIVEDENILEIEEWIVLDDDEDLIALPEDAILDDYEAYDPEIVKDIQRALRRHGYDIPVDGIFGPKTGMATKRFQREKKLAIDGIVGQRTLAALGLEDAGVYPRYAPNLRTAFEKSSSSRAIHLNLGSHKVEAWEKGDDGAWHLKRVMLAATGNQKKGLFTDLCNKTLEKTPTPGSYIGGEDWRGNYQVPITKGDCFHSILQHPEKGEWVYEDESVLGKEVTHGCVRLAVKNAKWLPSFAKAGTTIVVDDRAWNLVAEKTDENED